jgi:predicted PurR-regulated permease PerM
MPLRLCNRPLSTALWPGMVTAPGHKSQRAAVTGRRSRVGGWPIAIVGAVLVLLAYTLRYALVPFVFAAVISFVLEPVMDWGARHMSGHRWPIATVLSLLIVGWAGFTAWWISTTAFHDLAQIVSGLPRTIDAVITATIGPSGVDVFGARHTPQQLSAAVLGGARDLLNAASILLVLRFSLGTVAGGIMTLVLIPYFLISGPRLADGMLWLIPPERRGSVREMLPKLVPMLRRYVVGLISIVIYAAAVAYIGFGLLFNVPAAGVLAMVVGLLEMIPVIGPITSLVLVGLSAASQGTFAAIFLMLYAMALRLSIDNAVGPLALGHAARVHPVVVIFSFVIGAMLFGIIGLLLAVPTAASIKLILQHYYAEPITPDEAVELTSAPLRRAGSRGPNA